MFITNDGSHVLYGDGMNDEGFEEKHTLWIEEFGQEYEDWKDRKGDNLWTINIY